MIRVQRAPSLFTRWASGCWPRLALSGISLTRSSSRLRGISSSSALSSASVSLSRIRFGVPLGANNATQADTLNSGKPASLVVGTFGRIALRCSASMVYALIVPLDLVHVPYRGAGPSLTDLIRGQVQVTFESMPGSIGYIRAGKLRALAVTTTRRSEALLDLPTGAEFVPGYEASTWYGVGAPKATPAEIVEKLNKEINAALADPNKKARVADLGGDVLALSPNDFGKFIADEPEKWANVVKFADIKPE